MLDRLGVKLKRLGVIPAHSRLGTFCQCFTCLFAYDNTCKMKEAKNLGARRANSPVGSGLGIPG